MRIAHVIPYFQPKIGYQEYYLAREQMKEGHEVWVITSDRYFPFDKYEETMFRLLGPRFVGVGHFHECGIDVVRLPLVIEFGIHAFVKGLRKALKEISPQIVHAHDEYAMMTLMAIALKRNLGYRIVVDCHTHGYTMVGIFRKFVYKALLTRNPVTRFLLSHADGFIATTTSTRRWLEREWGVNRKRIEDIPLGADIETFIPDSSSRNVLRATLGINKNEVLIIYAGKIIPTKDIDILIRAVAQLVQKNLPVKLLLVGGGMAYYIEELGKIVKQTKTSDAVQFLEPRPPQELASLFNASDIGVWPGDPSIAIVEAMASGLPVVFPRFSPVHAYDNESYIKRGNGFTFKRYDITDLSNKLRLLTTDSGLRRKMGELSRLTAESDYGWNAVNKKTLQYYKTILTSIN